MQEFFNRILDLLGVKEAKAQEVFSIDEDSFSFLPCVSLSRAAHLARRGATMLTLPLHSDPVHGLVFLYEYVDTEQDETDESSPNLWFANQVWRSRLVSPDMD